MFRYVVLECSTKHPILKKGLNAVHKSAKKHQLSGTWWWFWPVLVIKSFVQVAY